MSKQAVIHIENMSKAYRMGGEEMLSLNGVNLTVYAGEMMAIIGPSGSGKSTLMNMMGCLDTPTSGTYWLDGQEVSKLSGNQLADIRNRKIGFIFQSFYLLPALTAMENVELPLIYRGMPAKKRHELAMQALTQVGLESKLNFLPRQLSGGQQQRVAIARALIGEPPVILADEPTGALDTKTGHEVLAIMKDLNRKGHTIVLITHDPDVAEEAGSVVRIQDGRIQVVRRFAP
ncbi:ABC transporter ATP-binding protein [Paenibacillus thiaminolyticus]|uniref:ABC transporter ATP-binding protein n=1 Tax=Paenibacillus thiaminolyticus TaxID=49283 RepID=A0AAP9J017_PANTH|nr:ABC transporter ATP-binding protein [Paenibacillus thiaminolyticus]MCY9538078.1 ABC transporter ATP-binding protein [Paenibacillus thiaminolyticus]MCY9605499.1 ABC transporter ATP-binding protein [Paenibacillus thiaminolyticus]MCY9610425.1 ABC transporter ATP-binding protein [Paenibacillus thiaminolyticus]MCY9612838.1 ABC transporter ATP-binding protein [Paenibacillus thiaminolyticus]MCY9621541.1 ABC transporter ATP-binding protein [Paenibacillus thiaminolyticus]